jgi:UDP-N-acetylmuramyl pentapeptide phosphotransferase/UDP-N-acetylglucosamine-1-phosphate transferase
MPLRPANGDSTQPLIRILNARRGRALIGVTYLAEATSVLLQTNYYKYARRRTGTGERIFRMAPLHSPLRSARDA